MPFVIALIVVIVLVVLYAIAVNNGLVRLKNRVDNAWSQIDVQLKRRSDLIPNLVETVKGYAAHEKDTLDAVIEARNKGLSAQGPAQAAVADGALSGAIGRLLALSEAYPDLKANTNFLALQEELTATEDKVGYARQFYNDAVTAFNTKIGQFPASILAGRMSLTAREYFQADEAARVAPKVQF
jgi:LemA protein